MFRHLRFLSALVLALATIVTVSSLHAQDTNRRGRKYKAPDATARIEVTVLRDINGKPIENAAVIFHLDGDKGNMELKTNEDGRALIDVLPIGAKMRLQIIARGFQTYGADYAIDQPTLSYEIRMKRPGEQYSIYKPHNESEQQQPVTPKQGQPK